jgi:oligopeptide transport system substrate-binding protein
MSFRILAGLLALLLAACSGDPISAREGARRKIFLVNIKSDVGFLDLQRSNSVADHQVHLALSEGLIAESKASDREVEPGVAEKWEANADSTVWTFHLRRNAKWSDGKPITAHDFVWSWRRMLLKELAAEYSRMLFLLKGGEAFYRRTGTVEERMNALEGPGVRAVDDYTLEVTLVGPTPHYPAILCHTSWWPVARHTIEKYGSIVDVMNPWSDEGKMVGNGPFKLKRRLFRQYVEVERNPHYWDAATVKLDGVRFYPIAIEQTEEKLFRRGQLHATYSTPLNKIPGYLKDHPDVVKNYTNCATWFFRCNTTRGPFKDAKVRRAMGLALDRQGLIDRVLRANQLPAGGIVPPLEGYKGAQEFHFDPAEAKKLMAEAGYPDGRGFPSGGEAMKLLTQKSETASQVAEAVQAMWKQHLGIHIAVIQMDSNVYLKAQHEMDYDVAYAGWNADYYDAATFLDMWITDGGNNETGWSNAAFDKLIADAGQCTDAAKRIGILLEAEHLVLKEAPVIPIYYATRTRLIHPAVKEWQPRLLDNRIWKYMDLVYPPPACSMDDELARD